MSAIPGKKILVLMQRREIDLCTDVVVRSEGVGGWGGGPLRLHMQTLTYMLLHEHIGESVCINTQANTTAASGWTLGAHRGFSTSPLANKIHSVSISEI